MFQAYDGGGYVCARHQWGACVANDACAGSPVVVSPVAAGDVTLDGLAMPLPDGGISTDAGLTLSQDSGYFFLQTRNAPLWGDQGGSVAISGAGGGPFNPYQAQLSLPGVLAFTSFPTDGGPALFASGVDGLVTWDGGGATDQVLVIATQATTGYFATCTFAAAAGSGTIPWPALAWAVQGDAGSSTLLTDHVATASQPVGTGVLNLTSSNTPLLQDGTSAQQVSFTVQ